MRQRKPRRPGTDKLYILAVDFPVKPEVAAAINEALEPYRQKYGLDFLVLEPGMRLSRFDEI